MRDYPSFPKVIPHFRADSYALLTRSPLSKCITTLTPYDLHVLSILPAFILSQDQTLKKNKIRKEAETAMLFFFFTLLSSKAAVFSIS